MNNIFINGRPSADADCEFSAIIINRANHDHRHHQAHLKSNDRSAKNTKCGGLLSRSVMMAARSLAEEEINGEMILMNAMAMRACGDTAWIRHRRR